MTDQELNARFDEVISKIETLMEILQPKPEDPLSRSIDDLDCSIRTYNSLQAAGVKTVGELTRKSEPELLRMKYLGRKSLNEVKAILSNMGLSLAESH